MMAQLQRQKTSPDEWNQKRARGRRSPVTTVTGWSDSCVLSHKIIFIV